MTTILVFRRVPGFVGTSNLVFRVPSRCKSIHTNFQNFKLISDTKNTKVLKNVSLQNVDLDAYQQVSPASIKSRD